MIFNFEGDYGIIVYYDGVYIEIVWCYWCYNEVIGIRNNNWFIIIEVIICRICWSRYNDIVSLVRIEVSFIDESMNDNYIGCIVF